MLDAFTAIYIGVKPTPHAGSPRWRLFKQNFQAPLRSMDGKVTWEFAFEVFFERAQTEVVIEPTHLKNIRPIGIVPNCNHLA